MVGKHAGEECAFRDSLDPLVQNITAHRQTEVSGLEPLTIFF